MRYFYFNPINKQYFFPEGFHKYSIFHKFYQGYSVFSKIVWFIWRHTTIVRYLFIEESIDKIFPLSRIEYYIPNPSITAFNKGTSDIQQKTTILGIDLKTKIDFFIKYAEKSSAIENVDNEGNVLSQLVHLEFVPKLLLHVSKPEFSLIRTNVFYGERMTCQSMDNQLLELLFILAKQKVQSDNIYQLKKKICFAHGDFCPWNIIQENDNYKVYDWEMAGYYPVGYDIFTFVFQTAFLIYPRKKIDCILNNNIKIIKQYFHTLEINQWIPYLKEFAKLKCQLERKKHDQSLYQKYLLLLDYTEKIN